MITEWLGCKKSWEQNIMRKRVLLLTLGLALTLVFTGCAANGGTDAAKNAQETTTVAETEALDLSKYIQVTEEAYTGLELVQSDINVTDEDVENRIQTLLTNAATTTSVKEGTVKDGDTVNIDFEGLVDGATFEGGSAQGYSLKIGSGKLIDGFESGLIGAQVASTVTLNLKFPDVYKNNPDLQGKDVVFNVTINSIEVTQTPALDETFVQANSSCKTVDEYRAYIRQELENSQKQQILLAQAIQNATYLDYPQSMMDDYVKNMTQQQQLYANVSGMEFADYLEKVYQLTEEEFTARCQEMAKEYIKQELLMRAIIEQQGLQLTDQEKQEGYTKYANNYQFDSNEALIEYYGEDVIDDSLLMEKAIKYIVDNAVLK